MAKANRNGLLVALLVAYMITVVIDLLGNIVSEIPVIGPAIETLGEIVWETIGLLILAVVAAIAVKK